MIRRGRRQVDITRHPELLRLVREMQTSDQALSLCEANREIAILMPVPARKATRPRRKGKSTSNDDPIWEIVGMINSGGPGGVAENVDAYLAETNLPDKL